MVWGLGMALKPPQWKHDLLKEGLPIVACVLLLLPDFFLSNSIGSYGLSTKESASSWERTKTTKAESGKK